MSQILAEIKKPKLNICAPCYPDFRFVCPNCRSFEVFVAWIDDGKDYIMKGFCPDCEKHWSQENEK